jgi:hypothetical protein
MSFLIGSKSNQTPSNQRLGRMAFIDADCTKLANLSGQLTSAQLAAHLAVGTKTIFFQAAAPTGWVQDTTATADNRAIRIVKTAGGGTGGSHDPILMNVVPAHTHTATTGNNSVGHTHSGNSDGQSVDHSHSGNTGNESVDHAHTYQHTNVNNQFTQAVVANASNSGEYASWSGGISVNHYHGITTGGASTGHNHTFTSGANSVAHTHSVTTDNGSSQTNWAPKYNDFILCTKA